MLRKYANIYEKQVIFSLIKLKFKKWYSLLILGSTVMETNYLQRTRLLAKKGRVWRSLPVLCVTLSAVADSQGIL